MRIYRNGIVLILVILFSCVSQKESSLKKQEIHQLGETEYYQLFIEAKKYLYLDDIKNAVGYLNVCIAKYPYHAAPYYELSGIYLHAQDLKRAEYLAKEAVALDTSNIWYKISLANIYQYVNKFDSAASIYESIIKIKPTAENLYNLSLLYGQSGKELQALKILNRLQEDFEKSKEVLIMKHNIFNNMREYDSAVIVLEDLIKYFPDDVSNYGILAEYLSEIGRNDYAKKTYDTALEMDSTNGLIMLSYGDFYLKKKMIDSAFYFYNKAFCCSDLINDNKVSLILNFISDKNLMENESGRILNLLGLIKKRDKDFKIYGVYADFYINQKKYEEANVYLDSALIIEKKNYMIWEQAIMIDNYLNHHIDAIEKAKECIKIFPDKVNPYLLKAYSEQSIGMLDSAIIDARIVLTLKPEKSIRIQAYNILAEIYRTKQQYELSDKYYEDILKIDPENLMIRNNYSYYLSVRGEKLEHAKELSLLTIQKEPENATYLDTYGWIMFRLGKLKEAKEYIEEAIRFGAVNNPEVLDHFGEIMLKLNKCKDAIEAWEKVIEIDSTYNIKDKLSEVQENCK